VGGVVTAVRARRVITPDGERPATVRLRDGMITAVAAYAGPPAGTLTLPDGHVLLPGLVDSHVHVNEPGRTQWEGFASATAAAAAGGVTTIVDMPLNSIPPTVSVAALAAKRAAAAGQLAVDTAFWGGAVPGNLAGLRPLHEAGVAGFKCFLLPSGVDEFPPLGPAELEAAMTEIASFGGLLLAHAEDPSVIAAAPAPRGRSYAAFAASRPPGAEVAAIGSLLAAARRTGCRIHVVHLSAAAALPLIAGAKAEGLPVSAETCPHYLALRAGDVPDGATAFKCCPPIRDAANADALWDALRDGTLDCVVSDHSPAPPQLKRLGDGDFGAAWGGIASVQLGLPVMWTHAARRGIGLGALAAWMAAGPARLAGLADRGAITAGRRADFCVLDPDAEFTVDPARLRHRHPVTPYAGQRLRGVVTGTWLAGEPVTGGRRAGRLTAAGGPRG
jgi:allantoinase